MHACNKSHDNNKNSLSKPSLCAVFAACLVLPLSPQPLFAAEVKKQLAFPGALGWAAHTPGGRGGKILRVTTLSSSGPGSFSAAVAESGPRIVVFEVGGVIDLEAQTLVVKEPFLTIAGQTAPAPGITLIRGGMDIATHDVVVRHLHIRPGDLGAAKRSGKDYDAISTVAAHDVIVDHCSLSWATDENLSASGPRFAPGTTTLEQARDATSRRITFSSNLLAEGLADSTHAKGEHSKGSLIHDHVHEILIVNNLYAHNLERSPLFKADVSGQIVNNLIYNPGQRAVHYNLIAEEWIGHSYAPTEMVLISNVMRGGPSTVANLPLLTIGGSGDLKLFSRDNIAVDQFGAALPQAGRYTASRARIVPMPQPALAFGVKVLASPDVQDAVIADAGARPWDRDLIDRRILADVIEGRGKIIDSQTEVGGYPVTQTSTRAFIPADWDLATMEPIKPYPRGEPLR